MKKLFIAALAVLALVGCKSQKQSELDFDAKAGTATIKGTVGYDYGYESVGGTLVKATKMLEQGTLVAKITYASYDAKAQGIKQVEAEIKDGKFEVVVPVDMKSITVNFDIRGFYGKHYGMLDREGKPVEQEAFYEAPTIAPVNVIANDVKDLGLIVMTAKTQDLTTRGIKANVSGTVKGKYVQMKNVKDDDESKGFYLQCDTKKMAAVLDVTVSCVTDADADGKPDDDREIALTVEADEKGAYSFDVDVYDAWKIGDIKVAVKPRAFIANCSNYYKEYDEDAHKYDAWSSQKLNGYYEGEKVTGMITDGTLLLGLKMADVVMDYVPEDKAIIKAINDNGDPLHPYIITNDATSKTAADPTTVSTIKTVMKW